MEAIYTLSRMSIIVQNVLFITIRSILYMIYVLGLEGLSAIERYYMK